jgi:subtilisin family serine protease
MNMSLGSSYPSSAEKELVALAAQHGISVACAAGNSGDSGYEYPASYDGATSVAAVDSQKRRAPFSTYNDAVDLAAPGVAIYSCVPGDAYDSLSGTSMASPHVAGAYALLASRGVQDREKTLVQTAERLGARDEYGAGLIDCAAAVAATISSYKTTRKQKL